VRGCGDLKVVVELGVVHPEEAILQGHDWEEAMPPEYLILGIGCPGLACHPWEGEERGRREGREGRREADPQDNVRQLKPR
jgi:hypothetical protein